MAVLNIPTPRVFLPLLKPSRYKGCHGGRASAKSTFFAELAIDRSITEKLDIVCIREIQKSLEFSVKKLLEQTITKFNAGGYFEVQDRRILTKNGGTIIFEGMQNATASSIKSLEGFDIAFVEEAQTLSQTSLDILRPTLRKETSELWFAWNPRLATDPIDKFLRSTTPYPDSVVVQSNYMDNPFLPKVMRDEMEYDQKRDPDKYAHVWLGGYQQHSEARVFKNWTIEEFETPANAVIRQGADWGFSVDPSVLVRGFVQGKKLYIDHEAYKINCEIDELPALFDTVPESKKWAITADSSRPETISYLRNHGFPQIRSAIKGPNSVEEGIAFLKTYDIVVHPRCKHTIDELSLYKYKTDKLTGEILPVLSDLDNHVIDSLRYMTEALRKALYKNVLGMNI
jgi:phage terminase large subunit